ncbi:hypothetical protein [Puniceicoccus vermicola]|uniref:Uncharacterized protein n=1 Tax=Puniceicoccus vermicola TaxID=388746 RepID=A0A7X1B1D1_9BACT|nr:hypothetical protein [Puniceicoccus vermicola]MBC2603752.1 hypothetical protein [Puniceicoccus vermicola]
MSLCALLDPVQIWYAFLGAALGSIFAIIISWRIQVSHRKKESQLAKEALVERLKFNNDRALQMMEIFGKHGWPNMSFDTTGIIIWLSRVAGILEGQLLQDVNWHRYQLDHINDKLTIYWNVKTTPISEGQMVQEKICREDIVSHLETVSKDICSLQKRVLQAEIKWR